MSVSAPQKDPILSFAVELHRILERVDKVSDVREVLALYVKHFGAMGAVLWEVAENVGLDRKGLLFEQLQYFEDADSDQIPRFPFYHLPMSSNSGVCIERNQPALSTIEDGKWSSEIPLTHPETFADLGIQSFMSVPISVKPVGREAAATPAADAALTFYRRGTFAEWEFDQIREAAQLFPATYRAIQDRASLSLLRQVQEVLNKSRYVPDSKETAQSSMNDVLKIIADHFQFEESAIYLHDDAVDPPDSFSRVAEIWPWAAASPKCYLSGQGGTGWVLKTGLPLLLLDVAHYDRDRAFYEDKYKGMEWADRTDIKKQVRDKFNLPEGELFPLSYACVPVVRDGKVTGALRCCISRTGPYHVDHDTMSVLSSAAEMIGDWWDHWMRERLQDNERKSAWSALDWLGFANRSAVIQWQQSAPTLDRIVGKFIEVCRKSVPQADVVEVWLLSTPASVLVRQGGEFRTPPATLTELLGTRSNAFRYALMTPILVHEDNARTSKFVVPTRNRESLTSFIIAPVLIGPQAQGIVLFGATKSVPWPKGLSSVAASLAEQLALYLAFHQQIVQHQQAQERLTKSVEEQGQLFLDFQHQLRTPINITRNSVERLREHQPGTTEWHRAFNALDSSSRRSRTVANNLQFFVSLAQGKPIEPVLTKFSTHVVLRSIDEASSFLYNKAALGKNLIFDVRKEREPYAAPIPDFEGARDLIELAVDNLLDNAVKYSFADSTITVDADSALYGKEVYFSFRNQGLPISEEIASRLCERSFRSLEAKATSPEGTGVGLWMVAEVMHCMGGRLEVLPTNGAGWNDIRIYFKGVPS